MPITLTDVPEEIPERILALVLVQSAEFSPRPSWHPYIVSSSSSNSHPTVISPFLVCRDWLRIATPIHYRHPVLRTPCHAELLLHTLRHTPALAPCVRSLHVHATSPALRDLVVVCTNLDTLDITVDNADVPPATSVVPTGAGVVPVHQHQQHHSRDRRVVEFCEAFARTRSIRHLVIRKNAYLTQPNATYVFEQLAKAIACWHKPMADNEGNHLDDGATKTVISSQWTSMLDKIEDALEIANICYDRLDGTMKRDELTWAMDALKHDPGCEVLLNQAVDRIHRLGQTRPVTTVKLIIENSIEARLLEVQKKTELANLTLGPPLSKSDIHPPRLDSSSSSLLS
ncbi:P-loop containing nucleoside triphosphate hydrolase protein [Cubamyces lactineus]|nr:P-loop containing nucleoside triphosphate hydrolase protein [Cubamyces lactineus]